jgi:nicotinate phosphoribosyltransferase
MAQLFEAQLVETSRCSTIINTPDLIAHQDQRTVQAAKGGSILEFGLRTGAGPGRGALRARASVIGGADATSDVLAGQMFGIPRPRTPTPQLGDELPHRDRGLPRLREVSLPKACCSSWNTYDTLKSGVPNAIKVFQELSRRWVRPTGTGSNPATWSYDHREARRMLDEAGFPRRRSAPRGPDETLIRVLLLQGAKIDIWAWALSSYQMTARAGRRVQAERAHGKRR